MTTHTLKIQMKYADAVLSGEKSFEVRKNDRGFKAGDEIVFMVVNDKGCQIPAAARHPLNGAAYRIDYILDVSRALRRSTWRWPYPRRTDVRNRAEALSVLWWRC